MSKNMQSKREATLHYTTLHQSIMMNLSLLTIVSLLTIIIHPQLSHSIRCNPQDKQVLLKIKQHFNNAYEFASWDPDTDCCSWYIVKCDRMTNRIINLNVIYANISGSIPDAVGDLPYLENLRFHKITNLTGPIPHALTRLTNLKYLTISWTNITGPIPSFLTQIKNLNMLDLSFNTFTGSIPPSLAQLRSLTGLMLDRNKLTGSIPDSFQDLPVSLQYLDLSHNQLSGTIPGAWGGANFATLMLQRNRFEGDASALFGRNENLQNVDVSRNLLEFNLSNVEFNGSLRYLDFNHNRIYGALPPGLAAVETLTFLNVSYNRLCGRIPTGGVMQEMDNSSYFHNKCLCGPPLSDCKS